VACQGQYEDNVAFPRFAVKISSPEPEGAVGGRVSPPNNCDREEQREQQPEQQRQQPSEGMGTSEDIVISPASMRYEARRLSTFRDWPADAPVEARKMAKAGFYRAAGSTAGVQCPWCEVVLASWDYGDQVMAKHREASPHCPFITNTSDNVPLSSSTSPAASTSRGQPAHSNSSPGIATLIRKKAVRLT